MIKNDRTAASHSGRPRREPSGIEVTEQSFALTDAAD
jgi:hypothetical protein